MPVTSSTWYRKPLCSRCPLLSIHLGHKYLYTLWPFQSSSHISLPHPLVTDFLMVWFPGLDYLDKLLAISLKSLWIFSFVHISFQTRRSPPPLSFLTTTKLDYDATSLNSGWCLYIMQTHLYKGLIFLLFQSDNNRIYFMSHGCGVSERHYYLVGHFCVYIHR